jgi:hypothetical protein
MNKSMMSRFTEAKSYQKKAIQALLPEGVAKHLEVIEQELIAVFIECTKDLTEQRWEGEAGRKNQNVQKEDGKRAKKVTID